MARPRIWLSRWVCQSLGMSAGDRRILSCDWMIIKQRRNCNPNRAIISVDGEKVQSDLVEQGWILVRKGDR